VAVSLRGHGESDKPDTGYRVEDLAADVVALLDVLAIERTVLAGHSGSCLVARRIALDHPERVAGLLLEASPTTLRGDLRLRDFVENVLSGLDDPINPDFARSFVTDTSSVRVPPDVVEMLSSELLKAPAHVWRGTFAALLEYDDSRELPLIDAPTLLVWGDDDVLVSRAMQHQLASVLCGATLLVYRGLGHTPRWEDPVRFSSDLLEFARQVERPRG
jgi:pimeloyl-ACP methyl ester carboxylesterase